jgi:general secretion pathway protein G
MSPSGIPARLQPAARHCPRRRADGFNLIELMLSLMILAILSGLAYGAYDRYREKVRVSQAVADIGAMSTAITLYSEDTREYPSTLAEVGFGGRLDPWGRPYQYLNLETKKGNGMARKDKKLAPLNTDFDLYSLGKDGESVPPLVPPVSRDDVVRARDGRFIGLAADFDP